MRTYHPSNTRRALVILSADAPPCRHTIPSFPITHSISVTAISCHPALVNNIRPSTTSSDSAHDRSPPLSPSAFPCAGRTFLHVFVRSVVLDSASAAPRSARGAPPAPGGTPGRRAKVAMTRPSQVDERRLAYRGATLPRFLPRRHPGGRQPPPVDPIRPSLARWPRTASRRSPTPAPGTPTSHPSRRRTLQPTTIRKATHPGTYGGPRQATHRHNRCSHHDLRGGQERRARRGALRDEARLHGDGPQIRPCRHRNRSHAPAGAIPRRTGHRPPGSTPARQRWR